MENESRIHNLNEARGLFTTLSTNIPRLYFKLTLLVIHKYKDNNEHGRVSQKLTELVRKTDYLFEIKENYWGVLLIDSTEVEGRAFVKRLYRDANHIEGKETYKACIAEIKQYQATLDEIIESSIWQLKQSYGTGRDIVIEPNYKTVPLTTAKISLIENDPILARIIMHTLENLKVESFHIEVKHFSDGASFLSSDFYVSSHQHIVLFSDILPRQNGIEVLYYLRKLPNVGKFTTIMYSERNFDEFAEHGYKNGLDHYLTKPIQHNLLKALIERILNRLWDR